MPTKSVNERNHSSMAMSGPLPLEEFYCNYVNRALCVALSVSCHFVLNVQNTDFAGFPKLADLTHIIALYYFAATLCISLTIVKCESFPFISQ